MQWIEKRMKTWVRRLQRHACRWWYAPLIAVLAWVDHFVVVIPTDGLLVSAVLLNPRRWIYTFLVVTLGSSLGALAFATAIATHGLPFMLHISPGIQESGIWLWTESFMNEYGLLALFGMALSPFMQHPAVALAALANIPLTKIFFVVLLGRVIKYGFVCWIASHMPHLLKRLWGMREEFREVGVADRPLLPTAGRPSVDALATVEAVATHAASGMASASSGSASKPTVPVGAGRCRSE